MSLPLSPPPSRSASQASFHKSEHTTTAYTTNSATTSISSSPLTPSSMTSPVSPGARRPRLSIPTLPSPQASTFLTSPTPVSTACSALQSFFSPCSSDEEDDDDSDDDEEIGTPSAQEKPKGHFQRLWASRDPPSTPPSCPPPPVPQRSSALGSPTFGWKSQKTEDDGDEVPDSWHTPPSIRESIRSAPAVLPTENRLSPTWQPSTPPSPTIAIGGGAVDGPPVDPFLSSLHSILTSQLRSLTPLLTSPPPELAAARLTRDKLLVKTQKAYFRRASVSALQEELQAAEERVRQIEHSVVTQFLGVLEGIVEGVKDGCETAMAAEDAAYQEWEQGRQGLEGGLECPPLEIVTESRPKLVTQASSGETIVHFTRPLLPPAPPPPLPQVESPLPSPQLSKLSPSPHPNSSPTLSTTTSISSSTTTSPSSSPISRGRGRLRGGTFGYDACACENTSDHDCANEAWPWDPLVVKVGEVEMRMI